MKFTILSNDKTRISNLVAKHSLSILVEKNSDLYLFGMGIDPDTLEHNVRAIGESIDIVDYVIVSHEHISHFGGFRYVSSEAPYVNVAIPYGSMESLGRLLVNHGMRPREISKWTMIGEDVYVSKPYHGPPYEHFFVIKSSKGLIVLSGCLHPGIVVLSDISRFFNEKIYALIGGFHLVNAPGGVIDRYVDYIAGELRPEVVVPLHCSGDRFIGELSKRNINVLELGVGEYFTI